MKTREVFFRFGVFFWGEQIMGGRTQLEKCRAVSLIFFGGSPSIFSINKCVGYYESSIIFSQSQSRFGVYTLPETKSSLLKMLSGPRLFSGRLLLVSGRVIIQKNGFYHVSMGSECFGSLVRHTKTLKVNHHLQVGALGFG